MWMVSACVRNSHHKWIPYSLAIWTQFHLAQITSMFLQLQVSCKKTPLQTIPNATPTRNQILTMLFQWINVSKHSLNKASYFPQRGGIQEIPMDSWPSFALDLRSQTHWPTRSWVCINELYLVRYLVFLVVSWQNPSIAENNNIHRCVWNWCLWWTDV